MLKVAISLIERGSDQGLCQKQAGQQPECRGIYIVHSPTPKAFANSSPGQRPGLAGAKQSTNSERVRQRQFQSDLKTEAR